MITICEHSFEETLLTPKGYVIDAGCGRDFTFARGLEEMGMRVICIDPYPYITEVPAGNGNIYFEPRALVASEPNEKTYINLLDDPDASTIYRNNNDSHLHRITDKKEVEIVTLTDIKERYNVEQFDIIKLDIEGAEYELLDSIDYPVAKQITIEFHDFRNLNPYYPDDKKYYEELMNKIGQWYDIQHDICPRPGWMSANNHDWDTLLILKEEFRND